MTKMGGRPATNQHQRIWLDDIKFTLKNIFLLWRELPQDVRIDEETLPASMVLFEVLEYLRKLKSTLDIHDIADRITEMDDLYDDRLRELGAHREVPKEEPKPQTAAEIEANKQSYLQKVRDKAQPPVPITPAPLPAGATAQFALLNGKLVKISPYGTTTTTTPTTLTTQTRPSLLPPAAGALKYTPITTGATSTGIRLEKQGGSQVQPVDPSTNTVQSLESAIAVASAIAKVRVGAPDEVRHGGHCLDTCHCKELELTPILQGKFSAFKTKTYCEYAMQLMISAKDDADPATKEPNVRELLFYTLFDLCSYNVKKMRKFLLVLSSEYACDRFEVPEMALPSSDSCVLVSRKAWELDAKKGLVSLGPKDKMCIPVALYKLFRPEAEKAMMSNIILQSTSTCCVSKPDLKFDRMTTVCLNPFHYKRVKKEVFVRRPHPEVRANPDQIFHVYRTYSTGANGVQVLCQYCLTKYDGRAKAREPDNEPLEERDPVVNSDDAADATDSNGVADIHDDVQNGQSDTPGAQPTQIKHIAVKDNQGITRIVTTTTGGGPAAKKARIDEGEPAPVEVVATSADNSVQCWRCLKWLESPVNMKHDCSTQLTESGALYSCRFCGSSSQSATWVTDHVNRVCLKSQISPHQNQSTILSSDSQKSKMMALFNDGEEEDRRRRFPKRVKCAQCGIEFYSERERILHTEKTNRCNGYITCRCCGGAFSTNRSTSHDVHSCFSKLDGIHHTEHIAKIEDVKSVQNPCMRPVKCVDCNHTIQTFGLFKRHKNALSKMKTQVRCGTCQKTFPSICENLAHKCSAS